MKKLALTVLSLAAAGIPAAWAADGVRASYFRREFVQWGFPPAAARLDNMTYMVYLGPGMDFNTGLMQGDLNDPDLAELRRLCRLKRCRIIGCLGAGSSAFAMMANPTLRATAARSLADWCRNSRLDGIDTDFEHPANDTDKANWSAFMTQLRTELGPRPLLSAAVANWGGSPFLSAAVSNGQLDHLHVMSYDYGGEHSTLAAANSDMDYFLGKGILRSRLVLGVPFYGVHVTTRDAASYTALLGYNPNPDPSVNNLGGYYFNGRDLIRTKAKLSVEKGAGVFTWIMDHDVTDGRSLLTAMHEGAQQGIATLDGFEYPLHADPNAAYTRSGVTLKPSLTRTDGIYGAELKLDFDGAAWSETRLTSPQFSSIDFPAGAAVRFDYYVPSSGPSGALFYFYDNQGRRSRYVDYSASSAGWHGAWYPRAGFEQLDGGFDYENIVRWMLLFTGTNGGTQVAPYSKTIYLDNLAIHAPGAKRPVRRDLDADGDGVPDICVGGTGGVVFQDRFRHHAATRVADIYGSNGGGWQWSDGAYGAGRRVLAGTLDFAADGWATRTLVSPVVPPFAVVADSVLHMELDVHDAMPAGTFIIDVLDDAGAYRRYYDYSVLRGTGLKHLDLRMSAFSGSANLARIVGWRIYFEGHGATSAPHVNHLDVANIAWGGLPAGSTPGVHDLDSDHDGLSDPAEDRNSNHIADPGETLATVADSDGDGTPDGVEVLLGTGPLDPARSFRAGITPVSASVVRLTWPSQAGTAFDVLSSDDMTAWNVVSAGVAAGPGTATTLEVPRSGTRGFYRVRLASPVMP